jgi:hypothetical protein
LGQAIGEGGRVTLSISHGLEGALPKENLGLVRSARAFGFVEDLSAKIQRGKGGVTVAKLNEAIGKF